jgi:hypothetical protein
VPDRQVGIYPGIHPAADDGYFSHEGIFIGLSQFSGSYQVIQTWVRTRLRNEGFPLPVFKDH